MARHDFCCHVCGTVVRDVDVPISIGAAAYAESMACPQCSAITGTDYVYVSHTMEWIPQIGRMSAGNGPTFQKFECYDAAGKLVTVDSITALRKIESESEKMARDGVGEGQMVWRDLSNDRSNKYDHAITKHWEPDDYPGTPSKEALARLSALSTEEGRRKVADAEATAREAAHQSLPPEIP